MSELHIFPFHAKENEEKVDGKILDIIKEDVIILRGMEMKKIKFSRNVTVHRDNDEIKDEIYYWQPIFQKEDFIDKGIDLVKKGLGFE